LTDDPTANTDYDNRFETDLTDFRTPTTSTVQNDDYDFISTSVENNPISLQEHVYRQIDMKFKDANERVVAHAFTENLQPSGWINTDSAAIAFLCGTTDA
jgi:DNA-directed RNA polymerase specialized sigma54-like protein